MLISTDRAHACPSLPIPRITNPIESIMKQQPNSVAILALALVAVSTASAQLHWDGNDLSADADGGSGTWDTSTANWDDTATGGNAVTWNNTTHATTTAVFGGTAGTVTLGGNVTVGALQFDMTGYEVSGANTIAFGGGTRQIITGSGISSIISSALTGGSSGSTSFTKTGEGTLTLNAASTTYAGRTALSGGTTILGHNQALGSGQIILNLTAPLGRLQSNGSPRIIANEISQAGNFILGGSGTGNLAFTNTLILGSTGKTLTVDAITVDFQGNITRSATGNTYAKAGSGTLIISGNASGFGGTTGATLGVSAGTVLINGTLGSTANNSGRASVSSGATLGGTGTITGTLTVNAGGFLAPGASAVGTLKTLDTASAVDATINGTLAIEVNGASADKLESTGAITLGGPLTVELLGGGFTQPSYTIVEGTSLNGTFSSVPSGYSVTYTDTAAILTKVAGTPFGNWMATFTEIAPEDRDAEDDPDDDGVSNLLEFAIMGDPSDGSNNGLQAIVVGDSSLPAGEDLSIVIAVRDGAVFGSGDNGVQTASVAGVVYTVEGSLDMVFPGSVVSVVGSASDIAPIGAGLPSLAGTDWEYHVFKLDASEGLPDKGFLRLRVATSP